VKCVHAAGAVLAALGLVFSITAQYFAAKVSSQIGTDLRQDMFDHIEGLSYTEMDKAWHKYISHKNDQ
jgi:ABC-type multidrug transport system fused ATPase/permease subunit